MAQLSTIVGSILRDMVLAQHEANLYALRLSESYRKNGSAEKFNLPVIELGEVDMEIRYSVKDETAETEQHEFDHHSIRRGLRKLSHEISDAILETLQDETFNKGDSILQTSIPGALQKLNRQPEINRQFCTFLGRSLMKAIRLNIPGLFHSGKNIDLVRLREIIAEVIRQEVIEHPEFQGYLDNPLIEKIMQVIDNILPVLTKDITVRRKQVYPSLDITIDAAELAKVPEECIHSLKMKVLPGQIRLNHTEDSIE
ncbi:MAG: hypothetical protein LUH10_18560 [Tannerellaceae bacterium]|nr:hypothetical protein [Tannerellaceae bacterium]